MDLLSISGIIVIEDNFAFKGTALLLGLSKLLHDKGYNLVIICDEIAESEILKLPLFNENCVLLNGFDIFNCDSELGTLPKLQQTLPLSDKSILIFDSFTSAIIYQGASRLVQILHKIHYDYSETKIPILGCIHNDCHSMDNIAALKWLATTWHKLLSNCKVETFCVKNRKITRKMSKYAVATADFKVTFSPWTDISVNNFHSDKDDHFKANVVANKKPNSGLTFDVGLKESEILAKKNLIAPYVKSKSEKESGKIVYFPDNADDIDEEDPDADLDI